MSGATYLADCAASTNACENKMAGLGADFVFSMIGFGLVTIWLVMWPIALWSVIAEPTGRARGFAWAVLVSAVPFVGAIAFWTRNRWMTHRVAVPAR
ncbi:hypothetical protein QSJ19_26200 [Gordonia sp. ABSL11-1]|uniref:hypothetical protein n=1 Tax=Gordonia sp. ABSL11-1 TaxID=3053924 RepID=UPI0025728A10|nr:hypothetical protein [Gordonia sp. ABSL11-1]MDL9949006.1 hypothetical protein [Gordonia sp. ABSL11-1]